MIQAYQSVRTYRANVSVTAVDTGTGKALGEAGRYRIVFDRAQKSFQFDLWRKMGLSLPVRDDVAAFSALQPVVEALLGSPKTPPK